MEVFVPAGALMSRNTSGHICQKNNNSGVNFIPFRENLKDYKIIGQGSVAIVGISNEIGNNFAIKMITKSSLNQKNMQYFLNELLIMKQINHPSIVCMKYVFQTETTYNLVLERGKGDLYDFTEKIDKSSNIIDKLTKDLCKGIEYIHNMGIYHRDIKPENVIIFYEESCNDESCKYIFKLCDFSLSIIDDDHIGKGACGSIGFYSPEISSKINYSRKYADYWSFGCLILEQKIGYELFELKWIIGCYNNKEQCDSLKNRTNSLLKEFYNTKNKLDWYSIKCLMNPIPKNRMLPFKSCKRTFSLDNMIRFMERKKVLKTKYEKIYPIED